MHIFEIQTGGRLCELSSSRWSSHVTMSRWSFICDVKTQVFRGCKRVVLGMRVDPSLLSHGSIVQEFSACKVLFVTVYAQFFVNKLGNSLLFN